jgi:hypothetical protein
MSEDWKVSLLVSLDKGKGGVRDCGAYRRVKILEHGMDIVERVCERIIRKVAKVNAMQCGFTPGRG